MQALNVDGIDPSDPLTDDALTGTFRVFQRARGHRYSLDDVLTAHEALRARPDARHIADIGCGLGSVLLSLAWARPDARLVGVEAQAISFALAKANVARNGLDARVRLLHGDLRDAALLETLDGPFPLVTGTPPYAPPGTSTPAPDEQKRYARIELRGGVEAYLASMATLLREDGAAVVCCDARAHARAEAGGRAVGLRLVRSVDAIPRVGHKPLFSVLTFERDARDTPFHRADDFVARNADGTRSEAYLALRASFGLPQPGGRDE